jgi:hypothetical protein
MFLHREIAKARAADSAISTEEESCRKALMKIEKGGLISVLTIKIPSPAGLSELLCESGIVAAST